ncbi:uncharacterized protein LOC134534302 [Bacillus rossius redtenbacheri]|uniref:uncharacterized protein LOC134534302 n=1 Tax=Bacillus rossius redtenbacheri TaxID=93214 RepID=UPI002FDEE792
MDMEILQMCNVDDDMEKSISFEELVMFALSIRSSIENISEDAHPLSDVSPNIIQESDHEIRIMKPARTVRRETCLNNSLYSAFSSTDVKKLFASNPDVLNKVLPPNSGAQIGAMDVKAVRRGCVMIADEELDLDDENEAVWRSSVDAEIDFLVPKSCSDEDAATIKHVMVTDDLKFHCKLCGLHLATYEDLFAHLNSLSHKMLTEKEERRLDFVYHKNLLLKVKQVRELLAEEGDHISVLQGERYNCKLCDKCFYCELDMFCHVTSLKHQLLKVRYESSNRGLWRLLEANSMVQHGQTWECSVCGTGAVTLAEAVMHIKKEEHKEDLVKEHAKVVCGTCEELAASAFPNSETCIAKTENTSEVVCPQQPTQCVNKHTVGGLRETAPHLTTKEENENLQNKIFHEEYKYLLYMCKDIFFCKLCTTFVSAYGVDYHVYSTLHSQALEERTIVLSRLWLTVRLQEQGDWGNVAGDRGDPTLFECRLCGVACLGLEEVPGHVAGEAHVSSLGQGLVRYRRLSGDSLACRLCHSVVRDDEYASHARSEAHRAAFSLQAHRLQLRQNLQELFAKLPEVLSMHREYFRPASGTEARCVLCKCDVPLAADDVWAHVNDTYHVSHMNYCVQKMLANHKVADEDKLEAAQCKNLKTLPICNDDDDDDANTDVLSDTELSQIDVASFDNVEDDKENENKFSIDCMRTIYSKFSVLPQSIKTMFSSQKNFNKHCNELLGLSGNEFLSTQNSQIIAMLQQTFQPVFQECKIVIFGSRMAGFAVQSNDIDVYLDVGGSKLKSHEHQVCQRLFVRMGYMLLRSHEECRNLKEVPYARTPIVRLTYVPLGIDCDINFVNEMSVYNTQLVRFYSMIDERVKMLILILRHWAKTTRATRLGTLAKISNYALTLLVIFYLQQLEQPVVPTVEFLQSHHTGEEKFIRGWNCSFSQDRTAVPETRNEASTARLLRGFFEFCGGTDLGQAVLCPHSGRRMSRPGFARWMGRQRARERFCLKSPLCVQDPLDLSHNVTKGVTAQCLASFQLACLASAQLAAAL